MRILVANDDGIHADGIRALVDILEPLADIYVSAPAEQQTAKGHSVTLFEEVKVERFDFKPNVPAFKVWGTPKDCVDIAVQVLLDFKPNLIVTGINEGPNLSNDCVSSGTIGAAVAGMLNGIPSVAVSLDFGESYDYYKPAKHIQEVAGWFLRQPFNRECILSMNIPNQKESYKGIVIAETGGWQLYTQEYKVREEGKYMYVTSPASHPIMADIIEDLDHDLYALQQNYIVISPIDSNLVRNEIVKEIRKAWEER